jgi:hypothetical protein
VPAEVSTDEPAAVLAAEPPLFAGKTPREWSVLKRGAMHLLSSQSVTFHNCGIFNLISAWLLNGMFADAVDANPSVMVESFIYAQHLPAVSKQDVATELELNLSTSPYATGCQVLEIEDAPLCGPNTPQGRDPTFKEMGLFWRPTFLAKPVDYSNNPDYFGREGLFATLDSTYPLGHGVSASSSVAVGPPVLADGVSAASSSSSSSAPVLADGVSAASSSSSGPPAMANDGNPTTPFAKIAWPGLSEAQKKSVMLGNDLFSKRPDSFKLQNIVGFYFPKFRVEALEASWRTMGILGSRPLHQLTASLHPGFAFPEELGFYIAPSNCPTYYANHFNQLAEEPNAEFTDHWAMQGQECIPTFTFCLMATRKLVDGEQIYVNYGPLFADLAPPIDIDRASPEKEEGDTTEDGDPETPGPNNNVLRLKLSKPVELSKPAAKEKQHKKSSSKRKLPIDPAAPAPDPAAPASNKKAKASKTDLAAPASNKKAKASKASPAPGQSSGRAPDTPPPTGFHGLSGIHAYFQE